MEIAIPEAGIKDIIFFKPFKVSGVWTSFGVKLIDVNNTPRTNYNNIFHVFKVKNQIFPDNYQCFI